MVRAIATSLASANGASRIAVIIDSSQSARSTSVICVVPQSIGKSCRFEVAFAKPSTNTALGRGSAQWGRDGYERLTDCET